MIFTAEMALVLINLIRYKKVLSKMAMTFGVTFALNKVLKSAGSKEKADMINLAGYTLTFSSFVEYLAEMKVDLFGAEVDKHKTVWDIIPAVIDMYKEFKK